MANKDGYFTIDSVVYEKGYKSIADLDANTLTTDFVAACADPETARQVAVLLNKQNEQGWDS
jgi:hypothetical protein|tara:strand:+ start:150 stop:335 length:186 start_codon:yes stop_codon:yes gene_type:complete